MNRHMKNIGDGFGIIEPRGVLEVKVVIGRRVVVKVVTDQEDLFNGRREGVDEVARGDKARCSDKDAFVVLNAVLTAFHVEIVDDVAIGYECDVEAASAGMCRNLTRPERAREVGSCSSRGERSTLA